MSYDWIITATPTIMDGLVLDLAAAYGLDATGGA